MRDGELYPRPKWERHTSGDGFGFWPTPTTSQQNINSLTPETRERSNGICLADAVRRWPTPQARDFKGAAQRAKYGDESNLPAAVLYGGTMTRQTSGTLNPSWVEWLMGWPIGWTVSEPLETDKFQQWLHTHGGY